MDDNDDDDGGDINEQQEGNKMVKCSKNSVQKLSGDSVALLNSDGSMSDVDLTSPESQEALKQFLKDATTNDYDDSDAVSTDEATADFATTGETASADSSAGSAQPVFGKVTDIASGTGGSPTTTTAGTTTTTVADPATTASGAGTTQVRKYIG